MRCLILCFVLLFALDKGILSPSRQETGSFEEVREKAFEGSDYDNIGTTGEEVSTFTALTVTLLSYAILFGIADQVAEAGAPLAAVQAAEQDND